MESDNLGRFDGVGFGIIPGCLLALKFAMENFVLSIY